MRDTSAQAYQAIKENGLLGWRQFQIYDVIYRFGPITSNQVYEIAKREHGVMFSSNGPGSRLSELRLMGAIKECGTTEDPITSMKVILWDVTDEIPQRLPKKEPLGRIMQKLKEENIRLRMRLCHLGFNPDVEELF